MFSTIMFANLYYYQWFINEKHIFWTIHAMNIIVYVFGKEMSQIIHFGNQILLKNPFFFEKISKSYFFDPYILEQAYKNICW